MNVPEDPTLPLLETRRLIREYPLPRTGLFERASVLRALDGVSISVFRGTSLGLIGESGSGKSTLARLAVALEKPDSGTVLLDGEDIFAARPSRLRILRRRISMVFQDPYGSLDPRHRIARIVEEPLRGLERRFAPSDRRTRVEAAIRSVGLRVDSLERYSHEFSGGQRQRIAIARALVTDPDMIVADESVSALDVSVQAQVLNLLMDLRDRKHVTYLFISHDLSVVRHVTDQVAVLYMGRIVEIGRTREVFAKPAHPYTRALVEAIPKPDPRQRRKVRSVSNVSLVSVGRRACPYSPRCPKVKERCRRELPELMPVGSDRSAACFYPD